MKYVKVHYAKIKGKSAYSCSGDGAGCNGQECFSKQVGFHKSIIWLLWKRFQQ